MGIEVRIGDVVRKAPLETKEDKDNGVEDERRVEGEGAIVSIIKDGMKRVDE